MTRAEAYAEGVADGRSWAEEDIRTRSQWPIRSAWDLSTNETYRAKQLGTMRGYRDSWARWDAGVLTWEMLEHAPVGK